MKFRELLAYNKDIIKIVEKVGQNVLFYAESFALI